ncbi:MAG: 3-isopropylmalate/(R)-2-methylmalate dehydratase large subunit [Thermoproteota archaeon]|nr:3-isopropylmalate/(R)-2-methylmalate dehydratase large subunit [Thermoproteota archaeon]
MTEMNIVEKIMARASGKKQVHPGDIIEAKIDKAMMNDITGPLAIEAFREMDGKKVWDKDRAIIVLDHLVPADSAQSANMHKILRDFAVEQDLKYFYDVGRGGVCHQMMMENHAKPGEMIVGADSHTCTYGAVGAFSTGIGSTDIAAVFVTGKLWFKIPKVINIVVKGKLNPPVAPKDLILYTIGQFKADGATYMGVRFAGEVIQNMSVDGRMTLCNMVVEMGAKNGIVEPDDKTAEYLKGRKLVPYEFVKGDADAEYDKTVEYNASKFEPMVACPPSVDNVKPISEIGKVEINQALLGSCTNGRLEDLRIAAGILKGKKVKKSVRALVIPASQDVYQAALREGLLETFVESGVLVCGPNCGPCYGGHLGLLAAGETCVSSTNRNFVGRMGSPKAMVYLASPATVAASAISGRITDPRHLEG